MAFDRLASASSLPSTEKLFHRDAYLRECDATVIHVEGEFVVLDRTIFYAESGGQEWDEGTIEGIRVIDVQDQNGRLIYANHPLVTVPSVKVDTVIVHRLEKPALFRPGEKVHLSLDWSRRYANMRQHSASHFLYAAARELFASQNIDAITKGCHIRPDGHRFDFSDDPGPAASAVIEARANELIGTGLPIVLSPEPMSEEIKYWRYGDTIIIPCGGTHVRSAGELGPIRVRRAKKGKNVTRLSGQFC